MQLKDRRALRAESPLIVRTARIALDVDDLIINCVNESAAPHRAIGADAGGHLGIFDSELLCLGNNGTEVYAGTDKSG